MIQEAGNRMKLIHLSDLHLGKRVYDFNLLEDQAYILKEILKVIDTEEPDGVIIAGDIYDKSVPSTEAVELLDEFLVQLSRRDLQVFLISGNHDSPERLAFASRLIASAGIHVSPVYHGVIEPIVLTDAYGPVNVYLLPFVKPAHVRRFFPDRKIESYQDALCAAIEALPIDWSGRNVLVTHQFVTGAVRSDSEEISVGGTDNIDAAVFERFDYVALGHIHGPQNIRSERIRYCGTPLKYSFSEAEHVKSVTVTEIGEKGSLPVRKVPLQR
jgi:exonuclease SbcD